MFKPSRLHHSSCGNNCSTYIPDTFGLLCWNVYKNNQKHPRFHHFLQRESEKRDLYFMLFQEAGFQDDHHFELPHFSYDGAANLEFRKKFYGVLTASRVESHDAKAYLSEGRESLLGPHKSLLQSYYSFEDGSSLLILNVHAINFRENQRYSKELERFLHLLKEHKGPMILAGDFNSWNQKRMDKLLKITQELSLRSVTFEKTGKVKSFMGKELDFVFYRELELVEAEVIDDHKLSDHHPLFVRFKRKI
ncbi:MAG: endonuclease/exonuclease/phosphatase family protein [Epsilonproteobacteria bacterium]|nr:MAG: endonuclease/exonuclease/phosphatase family protein [Campylobacterota bacterium]